MSRLKIDLLFANSGSFGCLEWSAGEDKILYVAEKKYKKSLSFFEKKQKDTEKPEEAVRASIDSMCKCLYDSHNAKMGLMAKMGIMPYVASIAPDQPAH